MTPDIKVKTSNEKFNYLLKQLLQRDQNILIKRGFRVVKAVGLKNFVNEQINKTNASKSCNKNVRGIRKPNLARKSKKSSFTKEWIFEQKFSNKEDAFKFLYKDNFWKLDRTKYYKVVEGAKVHYRCNRVTQNEPPCNAEKCLFYPFGSDEVLLYNKNCNNHDHITSKEDVIPNSKIVTPSECSTQLSKNEKTFKEMAFKDNSSSQTLNFDKSVKEELIIDDELAPYMMETEIGPVRLFTDQSIFYNSDTTESSSETGSCYKGESNKHLFDFGKSIHKSSKTRMDYSQCDDSSETDSSPETKDFDAILKEELTLENKLGSKSKSYSLQTRVSNIYPHSRIPTCPIQQPKMESEAVSIEWCSDNADSSHTEFVPDIQNSDTILKEELIIEDEIGSESLEMDCSSQLIYTADMLKVTKEPMPDIGNASNNVISIPGYTLKHKCANIEEAMHKMQQESDYWEFICTKEVNRCDEPYQHHFYHCNYDKERVACGAQGLLIEGTSFGEIHYYESCPHFHANSVNKGKLSVTKRPSKLALCTNKMVKTDTGSHWRIERHFLDIKIAKDYMQKLNLVNCKFTTKRQGLTLYYTCKLEDNILVPCPISRYLKYSTKLSNIIVLYTRNVKHVDTCVNADNLSQTSTEHHTSNSTELASTHHIHSSRNKVPAPVALFKVQLMKSTNDSSLISINDPPTIIQQGDEHTSINKLTPCVSMKMQPTKKAVRKDVPHSNIRIAPGLPTSDEIKNQNNSDVPLNAVKFLLPVKEESMEDCGLGYIRQSKICGSPPTVAKKTQPIVANNYRTNTTNGPVPVKVHRSTDGTNSATRTAPIRVLPKDTISLAGRPSSFPIQENTTNVIGRANSHDSGLKEVLLPKLVFKRNKAINSSSKQPYNLPGIILKRAVTNKINVVPPPPANKKPISVIATNNHCINGVTPTMIPIKVVSAKAARLGYIPLDAALTTNPPQPQTMKIAIRRDVFQSNIFTLTDPSIGDTKNNQKTKINRCTEAVVPSVAEIKGHSTNGTLVLPIGQPNIISDVRAIQYSNICTKPVQGTPAFKFPITIQPKAISFARPSSTASLSKNSANVIDLVDSDDNDCDNDERITPTLLPNQTEKASPRQSIELSDDQKWMVEKQLEGLISIKSCSTKAADQEGAQQVNICTKPSSTAPLNQQSSITNHDPTNSSGSDLAGSSSPALKEQKNNVIDLVEIDDSNLNNVRSDTKLLQESNKVNNMSSAQPHISPHSAQKWILDKEFRTYEQAKVYLKNQLIWYCEKKTKSQDGYLEFYRCNYKNKVQCKAAKVIHIKSAPNYIPLYSTVQHHTHTSSERGHSPYEAFMSLDRTTKNEIKIFVDAGYAPDRILEMLDLDDFNVLFQQKLYTWIQQMQRGKPLRTTLIH